MIKLHPQTPWLQSKVPAVFAYVRHIVTYVRHVITHLRTLFEFTECTACVLCIRTICTLCMVWVCANALVRKGKNSVRSVRTCSVFLSREKINPWLLVFENYHGLNISSLVFLWAISISREYFCRKKFSNLFRQRVTGRLKFSKIVTGYLKITGGYFEGDFTPKKVWVLETV